MRLANMHNHAYVSCMRYSHDPRKRAANRKKHGLDLDDAPLVIESESTVTFEDRRFDYGEQRFVTLGTLRGEVVVIVTAETEEEIRVISMRKAEIHEQEIYYRNL